MKIALITAFYTPAICGVKQVVEELAERYIKKGHEVHVYCSDSDKHETIQLKEEKINGVYVHRCHNWFTIANFATFWPSILQKLWKERFDIIHTHVSGHSYVFFAALVAKLKRIPHVHTTHCPWTEGYRSLLGRVMVALTYPTFLRLSFKWTDKIIAITPWELKFIEKYGGKKEKIKIIPNGMDKILLKSVKNNDFKKKLKIRKTDKIVLFFGRLNPTKAPDKLALAGKEILKKRKDVYFIFRGPDEGMKQKIAEMIKDEPNMVLMESTRDKKEIAKMYQDSDVFVMPSYREGLPLCCHPNTLIQTKDGLKEISKIKLNEMVLSHKGRFCKVIKIMKRYINEDIVCIKPYGINQEIEITKDHPVLSIKRPKKKFKKSIGKVITETSPIWVKSQELDKGDCVVFPVPKYSSSIKYFDLTHFDASLEYSSDYVWYKHGFSGKNKKNSYSNLIKKTGETKKVIESAINYIKKGHLPPKSKRISKIINFLNNEKFNLPETNKYPRFIKIDDPLAYTFGWYIAEGSTGKGFIRFALNKKEIEYAKKIDDIIKRKFGIKGKISIEDNRLCLVFCGKILVNLFSKLCGRGARNKRIPYELFNKKLLPHVLKGLFLGDGHFNQSRWQLSTASKQLANDAILALLKLEKKFNFHKSKRGLYNINYNPYNSNISHSNKSWFVGNNICFMIRDIKRKKYRGIVYNLEVKKDNSYTTSSFCVHNCLFEAMASGLPIVATPVNGVPYEMIEPDNGYFVPYGDINMLKEKILKLLDDKKLAKNISENNKKRAQDYDWDKIAERTLKIYMEVQK